MKKQNSIVWLGALALSLGLFTLSKDSANASVTAHWNVDDYQGFEEGEAKSSFITSLGEIRPGWSHQNVNLEFDSAWSSLRAKDGTIYIGSDDKATIYKVVGKKVTVLSKIKGAVAVVSLAKKGNTIYAGTMPAGEVWSINTKSGKAKKLATLDKAETVWSLALAGGELYAGTGPEGLLYKINTKSGESSVAFDSEDKRIMSLLSTGDKAIWLGTSDKALLFRHDLITQKTRAVADFAGNEVSALVELNGNVIAAANDFKPGTTTGFKSKEAVDKADKKEDSGQKQKKPKEGTKPGADKKTTADVEPQAKSLRKGTGTLYKVQGDGQLTQLHALTSSYFTSLAVNEQGQIFAGAADKGRIYMVDTDQSVSTAIDIDQRFIAQIHVGKNGKISFTTGDSANLYQESSEAKESQYLSKVFDAKTPARYGRFSWHSRGSLKIETRTGNTGEPGQGWSAWQEPTNLVRTVGEISRAKVASPPGRYFQYRASFGSDKNSNLRKTSLFYLPANTPTRITKVRVAPKEKTTDIVTTGISSVKPRSPVMKISWDMENDDGDKTAYTLSVRREGEVRWRPIYTGPTPLSKEEFDWNTETFPDGYYRLRVMASDRLENSTSRTLENQYTTAIFAIDNRRPSITGLSVKHPVATARATDSLSTISALAYSIDDGPWQTGEPSDQIFDDQSEILHMSLPKNLPKGRHHLSIRVSDSAGNVGTSSTHFKVN